MKNKLLVTFFARKALKKSNGTVPIYCKLRYNKKCIQFNTKMDLLYNEWDSVNTRAIGLNKNYINIELENIFILNMNKLFIILLFPSFMFSQIINIETKEESNKKVFSGTIEMEFDYNKSTEIDWEFINSTYLMWNIDLMTILLINEIDLNRAGDEDFANDGFQHLRVIYHINNNFAIESFIQNQHDLVHDIENRQLAGLGLRKIFSKLGIVGFSTFYEYEDLVDDFVNYDFRLNIYNKLKFEIFENLKFSNVLYFQPKLEDFFDYRFALEATLIVPLSESLSFNNSLSLSYDSSPAFEIPNTTYQFKNSLKYEF